MFYIGIDIAKHNHEASIIDSNGSLLCESISFTNSQKGCEKLIALRARGKHHLTAIGAVARKLCNIIFAVLRDNKPYILMPNS